MSERYPTRVTRGISSMPRYIYRSRPTITKFTMLKRHKKHLNLAFQHVFIMIIHTNETEKKRSNLKPRECPRQPRNRSHEPVNRRHATPTCHRHTIVARNASRRRRSPTGKAAAKATNDEVPLDFYLQIAPNLHSAHAQSYQTRRP